MMSDLNRTIKNNSKLEFDMTKLEEEYDYETDELHVANGRRVLETDLYHAVEFFQQDNPMLFVENLERRF
jgi:hypothetical protein